MEIRGERECTECGERWSYYETGDIQCPACGSIRSVGTGDRQEHTDGWSDFDLSPVREVVDAEPLSEVAKRASDRASEYLRTAGFVHAGDLQPLDDTYLAAAELRRVGATVAREMRVSDAEKRHLLDLLGGADGGERPAPEDVPDTLQAERGLAVAAAADAYASDLRRVYGDPDDEVASLLSMLRARRKHLEALDGEVEPSEAENVVRALRDLHAALVEGDETALARARERLD